MSPSRVGKYELIRKLATGGMAEVFLAKFEWARGLEKTVVVKRILPHLAEEPRFIDMFFAEAQLAARLNHSNIVQIIEFGEAGEDSFLSMEYIEGPSLRALLKRVYQREEQLPYAHCARIVASACEALAYAHDLADAESGAPLQLVHRDVSLDNILISSSGAVKLVDFGIAKATTQVHRTKTGIIKGKLSYMSPEQIRAEPVDRRADIYGLGVVLYELITGTKPFTATSEASLLHAIIHEDRVPLHSRRPGVPPELERIVNRALERDRELRYSDCRVMYADLESFLLSCRQPVSAFQLAELVRRYSGDTGKESQLPPTREAPLESESVETVRTTPTEAQALWKAPVKAELLQVLPGGTEPTDVTREAPRPERRHRALPPPGRMAFGVLGGLVLFICALIDVIPARGEPGHVAIPSADNTVAARVSGPVPASLKQAGWRVPPEPDAGTATTISPSPSIDRAPSKQERLAMLFERGQQLLKQKLYRQAKAQFTSCVELDSRHAECILNLGSSWARLGDPERGERYYREFLRLAPNHRHAKDVRKILKDYERNLVHLSEARAPTGDASH
jgi:serine/threonine protein kinase